MRLPSFVPFVTLAVFVASACASSPAPVRSAPTAEAPPAPADIAADASVDSATARVLGPNELSRVGIASVLDAGFGHFLQTIEVAPVLERGAFVGFRIVRFRAEDGRYDGIELHPGDVVTRVNGSPIERPEQALAVFQGLRVVSELRVEYTRDRERREIRFAIVD